MNYKPTPELQKWWTANYAKMRNDSSFTKATIVWNAATAAASAAAPQVVVDERKGSPYPEYDRGFSNGWDACAKRAAAPVQAQEPIADASADIFDLIREWAHLPEGQRGDAACNIIGCLNRSYSAGVSDGKELGRLSDPVQPVAVPDDYSSAAKLVRDAIYGITGPGFLVRLGELDIAKIISDAVHPLSAPAAQGDAKDAELRKLYTSPLIATAWDRRVGSCNASKTIFESDKSHFVSGWNCAIDAAIAAKAES